VNPISLSSCFSTLLAASLLALAGCGGDSSLQCKKDPITGSEQCHRTTSSGGEAAVMAGAAAAGWGIAGCTVNGCLGAYRCNEKTKMCEALSCDENAPCPAPYECNLDSHRCE
jgi:hypothetical protein